MIKLATFYHKNDYIDNARYPHDFSHYASA